MRKMDKETDQIRAIIIDDELPARENLRFMIEDHCPEISIAGTADGVESGVELFHSEKPDLLFLDIRMPSGAEGFELLEQLHGEKFHVVFVTAFKDYAIRAFEKQALHYILKPIDETELIETVRRITERTRSDQANKDGFESYRESIRRLEEEILKKDSSKRIRIHHSKGIKIIDTADITHLEGSGNCAILHFKDKSQYLDTRTLKTYETILPQNFYRIHKSFIVNMLEITEILHGNEQSILLKNGISLPVSRERKKALLDKISELP